MKSDGNGANEIPEIFLLSSTNSVFFSGKVMVITNGFFGIFAIIFGIFESI